MGIIAFVCLLCGNPGWAAFWALLGGHVGWAMIFFVLWMCKEGGKK